MTPAACRVVVKCANGGEFALECVALVQSLAQRELELTRRLFRDVAFGARTIALTTKRGILGREGSVCIIVGVVVARIVRVCSEKLLGMRRLSHAISLRAVASLCVHLRGEVRKHYVSDEALCIGGDRGQWRITHRVHMLSERVRRAKTTMRRRRLTVTLGLVRTLVTIDVVVRPSCATFARMRAT